MLPSWNSGGIFRKIHSTAGKLTESPPSPNKGTNQGLINIPLNCQLQFETFDLWDIPVTTS